MLRVMCPPPSPRGAPKKPFLRRHTHLVLTDDEVRGAGNHEQSLRVDGNFHNGGPLRGTTHDVVQRAPAGPSSSSAAAGRQVNTQPCCHQPQQLTEPAVEGGVTPPAPPSARELATKVPGGLVTVVLTGTVVTTTVSLPPVKLTPGRGSKAWVVLSGCCRRGRVGSLSSQLGLPAVHDPVREPRRAGHCTAACPNQSRTLTHCSWRAPPPAGRVELACTSHGAFSPASDAFCRGGKGGGSRMVHSADRFCRRSK